MNDRVDEPCAVAIGPILESSPYIANYRSTNNWYDGMRKRMTHDIAFDPHLMKDFKKFVGRYVTRYEPLENFGISVESANLYWLDPCKHYTVKRKDVLRSYITEYCEVGIDAFIREHRDFYSCMSFIKREFYSEVKSARIINSRSDEFKALCGAHIKRIENVVTHTKHFIKTITLDERVKRMTEIVQKYQYVFETDYSSFEGTQSQEFHQACEGQLFKHMLSNNPEVWRIIGPIFDKEFREVCISIPSKRNERMSFKGSRMSGDLWTSLGNGFSNMMVFLFSLHRLTRKLRLTQAIDADWLCEGDDGYFAANYDFSAIFQDTAEKLGLRMKVDHGEELNDVSFCSTCVGPGGIAVPNFWRILEKFGYVFDDTIIMRYSDKPTRAELNLLWAKNLSLNATSQGVPILQPLTIQLAKIIKPRTLRRKFFTYWEIEKYDILEWTIRETPITMEMRTFFAERFGVSVDKQLQVESFIRTMNTVRFVLPLRRPSDREIQMMKEMPYLRQ